MSPSRHWQIQWPSSCAIVKRRRGSGLVRAHEDPALRREQHPRDRQVIAHLDREAEQVLRDRLDGYRQLISAEGGVVLLAEQMRPGLVVGVGHAL